MQPEVLQVFLTHDSIGFLYTQKTAQNTREVCVSKAALDIQNHQVNMQPCQTLSSSQVYMVH